MKIRNCCDVIRDMINEIPVDCEDFIKELNWNYEDASYKAPEETIQWKRTSETLGKYITIPIEDWEFRVCSIFTTKSVEELKKM